MLRSLLCMCFLMFMKPVQASDSYIHLIANTSAYLEHCIQENLDTGTVEMQIEINLNLDRNAKKLWVELRSRAHKIEVHKNNLEFYALVYGESRKWLETVVFHNKEHKLSHTERKAKKTRALVKVASVLKAFREDLRQVTDIDESQWTLGHAFDREEIRDLPEVKKKTPQEVFDCQGFILF